MEIGCPGSARAYDFICLDIAEPGLNVNIVGGLPGLTTGYGPSHQATEDVAIFRGIPGLTIVDPCDSVDIAQAVPQLAACDGPTYLRLLRGQVPTVLDEYDYTFELGKAKVLRGGADVVFVSSGLMTMRALQAAAALAEHHVDVSVVHSPTLKPFDAETVVREVDTDRLVLTLENHTVIGGLAESVASTLAFAGVGTRVVPIALPDEFLAAGALPTLHDRYGLSTDAIVARVRAELGEQSRGGRRSWPARRCGSPRWRCRSMPRRRPPRARPPRRRRRQPRRRRSRRRRSPRR